MTIEQQIETNRLIAEFMDWLPCHCGKENCYKTSVSGLSWELKDMSFLNRWDWLMPVIEKISKYRFNDDTNSFAYPRTFGMEDIYGLQMFRFNRYSLHSEKTLIEAAYSAINEFLISIKNDKK